MIFKYYFMKFSRSLLTALLLLFAMLCPSVVQAQKVIFPQEKQPGTAVVAVNGNENEYSISNDLFTAKFVKGEGKLTFGGSEELGLIAGSEIFKVTLGDGTEVPASEFTLGEVTTETLAANENAVKGARRFAGVQIKAQFTHTSGLAIEWRAVLRDGSHYLRTEMEIKNPGETGIAMNSITPMMYTVQNVDGEKAPVVVGNTRGAVIASDKIFAGLETPTAYNTAGEATDLESFVFKAWDGAGSWAWTPEDNEIPEGIKGLNQYAVGAVNASRGYLIFREAGDCTITLDYTSGNNRLQILGVDILDLEGNVVDSDYHYGYTGGSDSNRDYTVTIPSVGAYMARIFVTNNGSGEGYGSVGTITYSTKVTLPSLVYDLASTETPYVDPEILVEEEVIPEEPVFELQNGMTYNIAANTKQSNGTYVPRYMYVEDDALKNSTECGDDAKYQWTLVAADNDCWHIKNGGGKYLSYTNKSLTVADTGYKFKFTDDVTNKVFASFALYNPTSSGGKYMVMAADGGSYNQNGTAVNSGSWCSDYILTPKPVGTGSINADNASLNDSWVDSWAGFSNWNGTLPAGVTKTGTAKYKDTPYYNISIGDLNVLFDYTGGNHGLYVLGVQVIDAVGNIVAEEFKNGFTGSNSEVTYNMLVPEAGVYKIRYITDYCNGGTATNGTITIRFTTINSITTEASQKETWTSAWTSFAAWTDAPEGLKVLDRKNDAVVGKKDPNNVQYMDKTYYIEAGKLSVLYKYTGGSHGLYPMGVVLLNQKGEVVATDYHAGFTGGKSEYNTYTVKVPDSGIYTVRFVVDKPASETNTNGDITLSLEEIATLGTINEDETLADAWVPSDWKTLPADEVPNRVNEVGCSDENARVIEQQITITSAGTLSVEFLYATGSARLNMVGVDLLDATGNVSVDDYHAGYTGTEKSANIYKFNVFAPGTYTIRYFADNSENINSTGNINVKLTVDYTLHLVAPATTPIVGKWSRITTLAAGEEWNVAAVVGVIAPGQARRSFLAYSERERAVPWRAVPAYISWYELNINRNNAAPGHEHENFTAEQCLPILSEWKTQLYDKYGEAPYAFVWDDGWDTYGEWQFHSGFPNGFTDMDEIGRSMGAGQGAWLGPVGGYGTSGGYRRAYWNSTKTGGMQLSNPLYYEVFVNAVTGLLRDKGYDFRFFKFDGISAQFSSVGPDAGATGNENAEAIIMAEQVLRSIKEDVFLNTTVGTWASPFWFQFTDAIWRQEKDDGTIGNNSNNRENWITYRDRLVHQNFVQNSPLCPINTLMTHGFILTEFGGPAGFSRDWKSVVNELRCAFACGSGMVELYNDYKLTNNLVNPATGEAGELWGEIAKCMQWQRKNADVLPDIHWVGGNPWTGAKAEVYGWASWNGEKATLALRNGANDAQTYTFTLREALDIPEYINTTVTLTKSFDDQAALEGLPEGEINIDTELTVTLPGSSVYVFDGVDNSATIEAGKYYRFKDANGKYLSAAASLSVTDEADASTIFYLTEDSKLLSYSNGLFLNKTAGFEVAGHGGNVAHFKKGAVENNVMIGVAGDVYLSSDGTKVATEGGNWTIEEVTSLPVTISAAKYATFYAPVAVTMPEGITAHTVTVNEDRPTVTLSDPMETVPGSTGIILYADVTEETAFDLAITETANTVESVLKGTVNRTLVTKPEGKECYVLANGEDGVGLYVAVIGTGENEDRTKFYNGSHKAYLEVDVNTAQNISFYGFRDGTTAVETVEIRNEKTEIYDLAGRRVNAITDKGVYIVNGKKVIK